MFGNLSNEEILNEERSYGGSAVLKQLDEADFSPKRQPSMRVRSKTGRTISSMRSTRKSPRRSIRAHEDESSVLESKEDSPRRKTSENKADTDNEEIIYGPMDGNYEKRAKLSRWLSELREQAPHLNIPTYPPHMPIADLEKAYLAFKRSYFISQNVTSHKRWMLFFFVALELFAKKLKLPLDKFATIQLGTMKKYEQYLIRIGEKNVNELMKEVESVEENPLKELFKEIGLNILSLLFMNVLGPKLGETECKLITDVLISVMNNFASEDLIRKIESVDVNTPMEAVPQADGDESVDSLTKLAIAYLPKIAEYVPALKNFMPMITGMLSGTKTEPKVKRRPRGFMNM